MRVRRAEFCVFGEDAFGEFYHVDLVGSHGVFEDSRENTNALCSEGVEWSKAKAEAKAGWKLKEDGGRNFPISPFPSNLP